MNAFNQAAGPDARKSLQELAETYDLAPNDPASAAAYGQRLSENKKHAEAGKILMIALHSYPDNSDVLKALSKHFMQVNNFHAAKTCLNKAEEKPYHRKEWQGIIDRAASIAKREQESAATARPATLEAM